jgi:hypothetical protein
LGDFYENRTGTLAVIGAKSAIEWAAFLDVSEYRRWPNRNFRAMPLFERRVTAPDRRAEFAVQRTTFDQTGRIIPTHPPGLQAPQAYRAKAFGLLGTLSVAA